jgi:hypothetical protein
LPTSSREQLIRRIVDALDAAEVESVIIGGQAVNYHGHSRFTRDVDITVRLAPWEVDRVLRATEAASLRIEVPSPREFVAQTMVLPCLDEASRMGVDISFVDSSYAQGMIQRAAQFPVAGRLVRFLSIEDLLIQKVIANRPQDRIDVVELFNRHRSADVAYIRNWLRQFEEVIEESLVDRFDELVRE